MSDQAEFRRLVNPVKRRMEAGEFALGMIVHLARSGDIARIAKSSGHDFLFIDGQHAIFSPETVGHIVQAALGCGIAPLVRARNCRDPSASLILDAGAMGMIFPDVNTAEDARLAVKACKFKPIGERSLTATYALFDHVPVPLKNVMQVLNEVTLVVCMIETRSGLDNVDEIAAVEGVDVLLVGLSDYLADAGKPGAFDDPAAMKAVGRVAAAARAQGKFSGVGGDQDVARLAGYIGQGVRFITTRTDAGFLMSEASRFTDSLRQAGVSR